MGSDESRGPTIEAQGVEGTFENFGKMRWTCCGHQHLPPFSPDWEQGAPACASRWTPQRKDDLPQKAARCFWINRDPATVQGRAEKVSQAQVLPPTCNVPKRTCCLAASANGKNGGVYTSLPGGKRARRQQREVPVGSRNTMD